MADLARQWVITFHDDSTQLSERRVPFGLLSEAQAEHIQLLVDRYAELDAEIIVNSILGRDAKNRANELDMRRSAGDERYCLTCGDSVHAVARLEPWSRPDPERGQA